MVLGASFIGFGSLVHNTGFGLWPGLVSTLSTWALPGQIAMVELYGIGAGLLVNGMAVGLTNTRLLPMVVTLAPALFQPRTPGWQRYLVAHLIAVTSWALAMRRCPELPPAERLRFFVSFALSLWAISLVGTAAGFALAGSFPRPVSLALTFLNPTYFLLLLVADIGPRARGLALLVGAVAGPALHLVTPDWGLLISGLAGGSAAFALDRWLVRRAGRRPWGGQPWGGQR
jgi:predicted branched-subunit amino acid permease